MQGAALPQTTPAPSGEFEGWLHGISRLEGPRGASGPCQVLLGREERCYRRLSLSVLLLGSALYCSHSRAHRGALQQHHSRSSVSLPAGLGWGENRHPGSWTVPHGRSLMTLLCSSPHKQTMPWPGLTSSPSWRGTRSIVAKTLQNHPRPTSETTRSPRRWMSQGLQGQTA